VMPTALDNGLRSPRRLLATVVACSDCVNADFAAEALLRVYDLQNRRRIVI
jgi:hypothetical protein